MQNNRPHTNNSFPATFIPPFWQFLNFLKDLNGMKEITFTNTTSISKYFTCNIYIQLVKVYFGSATSVHPSASFWHILPNHEPTEFVEASVAIFLTIFASSVAANFGPKQKLQSRLVYNTITFRNVQKNAFTPFEISLSSLGEHEMLKWKVCQVEQQSRDHSPGARLSRHTTRNPHAKV